MPAWKPKRCVCTVHGCANSRDPDTGEIGVHLEPAAFKRHQTQEKLAQMKNNLEFRAVVTQRRCMDKHEEALENAMKLLKVREQDEPSTTSIQARERQYMIDMKKRVAESIGAILDDIRLRNQEIDLVDASAHTRFTDQDIQKALQSCHKVRALNATTSRQLGLTKSGPLHRQPSIKHLRYSAEQSIGELNSKIDRIEAVWRERRTSRAQEIIDLQKSVPVLYDSSRHFLPFKSTIQWMPQHLVDLMQLVNLMVVVGYVLLGFSRRACYFLFCMCEFIAQRMSESFFTTPDMPKWAIDILRGFPLDVRAATKRFDIEARFTVYAACPKCNEIYKPILVDQISTYPDRCNAHRYGNRCGELLVRPKKSYNRTVNVPIKPYLSFDFQDWLASMLSRRGYEKEMDAAWNKSNKPVPNDGRIEDIFESPSIRMFKGCDGELFSNTGNSNIGKYLFSLGFDFFNPLRNLAAGKKISIGVIALVCLNLPITLRYKSENIFLAGIIPGPKEPSLESANPYFRPIVDAFLLFWTGVFFNKTALYNTGRIIMCALLAIIADLPAARKIGGFASHHQEYFCSVCWCNRTMHTLNDYQYNTWTFRTDDECRTGAWKYEAASSEADASSCFNTTGLRTSEFHRLPYYRPTRSLVVDPMHNLFLGLIKEHFQHVLGDGTDMPKRKKDQEFVPISNNGIGIAILPTEENPLPKSSPGLQSVRRIRTWLAEPLPIDDSKEAEKLARSNNMEAIVFICKLVSIPITVTSKGKDSNNTGSKRVTKDVLTQKLVDWRKEACQHPSNTPRSKVDGKQGNIMTQEEMNALRRDISAFVKPSWFTSLPASMSAKSGKLKSDQWRAAGQVYIPMTLIRLWTLTSESHTSEAAQIRWELLRLTMLLFEAISVITSRVVSPAQAKEYLDLMIEYRSSLARLFPSYECVPNQHMAMHMGEFVLEYGPVHGWWTFPFERLIGMLQRISTNYKQGEYEETIARTWHRRANLSALFMKVTCPPVIRDCVSIVMKLVSPQQRNVLADETDISHEAGQDNEDEQEGEETDDDDEDTDQTRNESLKYDDKKAKLLKSDVIAAFSRHQVSRSPSKAVHSNRYRVGQISYTSHLVHKGNSGILDHSGVPYRIHSVLKFNNKILNDDVWFVVNRHQNANVSLDPYVYWLHYRARMWGVGVNDVVEVLPLSAVQGHFAKCVIPWEGKDVAVCISLSRLRPVERLIF